MVGVKTIDPEGLARDGKMYFEYRGKAVRMILAILSGKVSGGEVGNGKVSGRSRRDPLLQKKGI
jgi:hypothetical protein